MTPSQSKALSIKKWKWIVDNNGKYKGLTDAMPELKELVSECSFCEVYFSTFQMCRYCPLANDNFVGCPNTMHPYSIWRNDQTKENAQDMLNLILLK
jgi:hypothetical protein